MGRLDGQVAIVTGGSRGIGEAIALAFAREGARVVVASRKEAGVRDAAARINAEVPGSTVGIPCHVGQPDAIEALFERVCAELGTPRVLVNNAGTNPYFGPMLGTDMGAWRKTFEVNLEGPFLLTRAFAQRRFAHADKSGSVIFMSSILGLRAAMFQGVYGMTKAAMISMCKTLALELGETGIRVNAIAPGFVDTKLSAAISTDPAMSRLILDHTPQKRMAQPDEIAGAAVFLASDDSRFVTGHTLVVDGGFTIV